MVILCGPTWGPQSTACSIWQWPKPPLTPVGPSAQVQLSFPLPIPDILATLPYCLALMPASPWPFPPGPLPARAGWPMQTLELRVTVGKLWLSPAHLQSKLNTGPHCPTVPLTADALYSQRATALPEKSLLLPALPNTLHPCAQVPPSISACKPLGEESYV